jgi:hypothetical protein
MPSRHDCHAVDERHEREGFVQSSWLDGGQSLHGWVENTSLRSAVTSPAASLE